MEPKIKTNITYTDPFVSEYPLDTNDVGYAIVWTELLVVLITLVFLFRLESEQRHYLRAFKMRSISMENFAITIKTMPPDHMFDYDQEALKFAIAHHF